MGSIDLIRMLEPVTRPDGVKGIAPGSQSEPRVPLEQQSFEMLLEEAQGEGGQRMTDGMDAVGQSEKSNSLGVLGGLNRVDNASLANLIARHRTS